MSAVSLDAFTLHFNIPESLVDIDTSKKIQSIPLVGDRIGQMPCALRIG